MESEKEWSDNKKLIELSKHNGDICKAIPKGFSYFTVNFGLQPGYVHLIENDSKFSSFFAQVLKKLKKLASSGSFIMSN